MNTVLPEHAARIIPLLRNRDGELTIVTMSDGRVFMVFNVAWGKDEGEDYEHVTTNISPSIESQTVDLFLTSEVAGISVPESGELLWSRADLANVRSPPFADIQTDPLPAPTPMSGGA